MLDGREPDALRRADPEGAPREHRQVHAGVHRQARSGGARRAQGPASPRSWRGASARATFAMNRRTKGGPIDHDLPVLFVKDAKGKVRAVYLSYACHCVTLSHNKIGGDWAGFAADAIEDTFPARSPSSPSAAGPTRTRTPASPATRSRSPPRRAARSPPRSKRLSQNFLAPVTGAAHREGHDARPAARRPADARTVGGEGEAHGRHRPPRPRHAREARPRREAADEDRLPGPDVGLRRLAGDGPPARRSRRRLLAAAEEGTRRPAALGHRLRQQRPVLHPERAHPEGGRLRGRRGDDLLRPARAVHARVSKRRSSAR